MKAKIAANLILERKPALPATIPQSVRPQVLQEPDGLAMANGAGKPATIRRRIFSFNEDPHDHLFMCLI